jgi:hypothetical protein
VKVTQEMIDAFSEAKNCACHPEDEIGTRLQAVLDMPEVRQAIAREETVDIKITPRSPHADSLIIKDLQRSVVIGAGHPLNIEVERTR